MNIIAVLINLNECESVVVLVCRISVINPYRIRVIRFSDYSHSLVDMAKTEAVERCEEQSA